MSHIKRIERMTAELNRRWRESPLRGDGCLFTNCNISPCHIRGATIYAGVVDESIHLRGQGILVRASLSQLPRRLNEQLQLEESVLEAAKNAEGNSFVGVFAGVELFTGHEP